MLSVVVPVYALDDAAVAMALGCLEAFREHTAEPFELICVDNGSVGLEEAAEIADKVVRLDPNRGFSGGVNAGLAIAEGEYLAVGSADTFPCPGWAPPLMKSRFGLATPFEKRANGKRVQPKPRMGGFFGNLWVMRREVYETLGPLDTERFPLRYGDTDYAIRAAKAGFWVGQVEGSFAVQIAKHHSRQFMTDEEVYAERDLLIAHHGHRFFGDWLAAR